MKKDKHPEYRAVLFVDEVTSEKCLINSTKKSNLTGEYQGKQYPMVKLSVSSASHPFYRNEKGNVGMVGGRAEMFNKKYGKK